MTVATVPEVIGVLEEAVFCDPGTLSAGVGMDRVPGWDSNSAVFFLGEVSGRFGVELTNEDLRACPTVGDLAARVVAKAKR